MTAFFGFFSLGAFLLMVGCLIAYFLLEDRNNDPSGEMTRGEELTVTVGGISLIALGVSLMIFFMSSVSDSNADREEFEQRCIEQHHGRVDSLGTSTQTYCVDENNNILERR